ncbi:MAG: alpha/beta hydrolase [Dehalococcoidia bacterium]|nr:MAG: alpha/beta hydrolase [Dehalococcoidia bacterium]
MKEEFNSNLHELQIHESGEVRNPMIVFLHGVGASGLMWESHLNALSLNYHCIAPDLPGHGGSNKFEWSSMDEITEYVYNLIGRYPHKKAHVVGLSLGASVTINLLSKHGKVVDHAIVDGAGVIPIRAMKLIKLAVSALSPFIHNSLVIKIIASSLGISREGFEGFMRDMKTVSPASFRRAFSQANEMTLPDGMDKVASRTLFVAGETEAKETRESNMKLAQLMVSASYCIAPKLGHGWLARALDMHVEMTKAWIEDRNLPSSLKSC